MCVNRAGQWTATRPVVPNSMTIWGGRSTHFVLKEGLCASGVEESTGLPPAVPWLGEHGLGHGVCGACAWAVGESGGRIACREPSPMAIWAEGWGHGHSFKG